MRRREKKIEDEIILREILSKSTICRLGLFDDEYPYVVPMNYGYDGSSIYFHCAAEGKKIDLIRKNSRVCFEIEQGVETIKSDISCHWTTKYRSIIGYGNITIIKDKKEKVKGLNIIMKQHGGENNSFADKLLDKLLVLKLDIAKFTGKQSGNW